jgi:tetratricopeptide (TPR) repeat protein
MGLVTSDAVQAGAKLRRRLIIGAASLLVLVGIIAGGWYVWTQTSLFRKQATVDYSKLSPTAAVKAAQAQITSAQTSSEKQAAYTALGDAYSRTDQTSQTEAAYQQAITYSPDDIPLLERLSSTYDNAGDTADAIKTLQKLIDAINATNPPDKAWLLSRYQAELKHDKGDY